ncbi:TerB family tellurite resistance protein [Paracoccus sp. Z118]|uniref:tellurite resistance TerB family protein n=1 Tax=Paracoccus sp. Z118 TaxID=2851017 RepID=UPI001C2C8B90|nr:TerB family tellurite resistance protein [Paracoccus sp. Z118]MBV0891602.1 TerB family tellurite resistance protein [Paracoccus sp. Z118]
MFRSLLSRLFSEESEAAPLAANDADMAVAALLVRLARADDRYSDDERTHIDHIIATRHRFDPEAARDYRVAAEMIEAEAPDTVRFTRMIKDRVPLESRISVIAAMWQVAFADGRRSEHEDALIRLAANLLGVTDRESAVARQEVVEAQARS